MPLERGLCGRAQRQPADLQPARQGAPARQIERGGEIAEEKYQGLARLALAQLEQRGEIGAGAGQRPSVENLQRADLSPIDEAAGLRRLISDFNQTQEEVAKTVGKSRPHVANTLRLLDLPPDVQDLIREEKLSAGHGRTLLSFPDPSAMAQQAIREKLSVRDLEKLAAGEKAKTRPALKTKGNRPPQPGEKTGDTKALEKRIEEALGLRASLTMQGGEKTMLTLEIADYEQLDSVVEKLTRR